jgi:hypothetical protein
MAGAKTQKRARYVPDRGALILRYGPPEGEDEREARLFQAPDGGWRWTGYRRVRGRIRQFIGEANSRAAAMRQSETALGLSQRHRRQARRTLKAIAELTAEWDRRLVAVQGPDFRKKVEAVMNARGRTKVRPKAGPSY